LWQAGQSGTGERKAKNRSASQQVKKPPIAQALGSKKPERMQTNDMPSTMYAARM
jgi:hypothetical protein